MCVGDDELGPGKAAIAQVAEELGPERFGLGVTDVDAEHLSVPVDTESCCDHDCLGHDVAVLADVLVGGIEPDVDERLVIQSSGAQHGDIDVDLLADPRHRRLADTGVATECLDEVVDLAGARAADVGGHDHRPQRLVDPAARLEQLGEERPLAELGDVDFDTASRC